LVDVAAAFVVENKGVSRRELDFALVLDAGQLANSLIDVAFVKDSVGFPEHKDWVGAFLEFLYTEQRLLEYGKATYDVAECPDGAPEFLTDEIVDLD
jgi:hypothetical protein